MRVCVACGGVYVVVYHWYARDDKREREKEKEREKERKRERERERLLYLIEIFLACSEICANINASMWSKFAKVEADELALIDQPRYEFQ